MATNGKQADTTLETISQPLDESVDAPDSVQGKKVVVTVKSDAGTSDATEQPTQAETSTQNEIPDEIRAELAAISTTFAEKEKIERSPDLPLPADITNKVTKFLALSKVDQDHDRDFLQLLEMEPIMANSTLTPFARPLQLEYDPEWLAILRTFDPELQVGGKHSDTVSAHRGDTYYRDRIIEERAWIDENIKPDDLVIPQNFRITVERDDNQNALGQDEKDMPIEQTNPQTASLCKLIGIENKFDFSDEERIERMTAGPAAQPDGGNWRGGRGRGGGKGRGRSGRGRGRRGRW